MYLVSWLYPPGVSSLNQLSTVQSPVRFSFVAFGAEAYALVPLRARLAPVETLYVAVYVTLAAPIVTLCC